MQIPTTYCQRINSEDAEKWKEALDYEYNALLKAGTWTLKELPPGRKPIDNKWVFRIKKHSDGSLDKFRARLCAKGFTQKAGEDFDLLRTYAPVAGISVVRTLLGACVEKGWQAHQYDISSAYLNSPLKEEVYMKQPQDFDKTGKGEFSLPPEESDLWSSPIRSRVE